MKCIAIASISLFLSVCSSSKIRCYNNIYSSIKQDSTLIINYKHFREEQEEWIRTPLKDTLWTIPLKEKGKDDTMKVEEKVFKAIADVIGTSSDDMHDTSNIYNDLMMDSLDVVELMMKLEEVFEIELPDDVWDGAKIETVGDVIKLIGERVK